MDVHPNGHVREVRSEQPSNTLSAVPLELYTVGYEGRSVDDLLETLIAAKVTRLVDVRELPLSRRRGLSKTALGDSLAAVGIEYAHVRPLGNPKENRERCWAGELSTARRSTAATSTTARTAHWSSWPRAWTTERRASCASSATTRFATETS